MTSLSDRGFVVDRAVFFPAIVFLLSTVGIVLLFPVASHAAFGAMQAAIVEHASWDYGRVMAILLVTSGVLAFSRVGSIGWIGSHFCTPPHFRLAVGGRYLPHALKCQTK